MNEKVQTFICSKLTIETVGKGGFIVNFENISHLLLVFIADFEQVNVSWESVNHNYSQPAFACSKSRMKISEQCAKLVQS